MSSRKLFGLVLGALFGVLLAVGYRLYSQRQLERTPGAEGLDEPAVAAGFARMSRLPQFALLRRLVASRALAFQDSGEAIDLGCGPGYLALDLVRAAPGLRVTGVDLSNSMLRDAIVNASEADLLHRVEFRTADAAATGYPDAGFDLVISSLSLHHWSEPGRILNEVERILKPGGAFVIFDLRRDMAAPAYLLLLFATRYIVPRALRYVGEPLGSRNSSYTPEEAAQLAQSSGLTGWRVASGPFWLSIEGRKIG